MDTLISIVNDLQDAFASLEDASFLRFDLPQIAVLGNQSAGKSSVLENFVGKDFLPRGSGIVTRRPLILQLVNSRQTDEEYGEFLHRSRGHKFYDFYAIRAEIEAETNRLTGSNKGISAQPINLKIHSPKVLDLTLIDLPGMTKVPVGDQPEDIEIQIRDMIRVFIENPNCLILAVSPANSDLATSDALQFAQEVDPEGLRTIGVLTKLDLMDQGTDAKEILENRQIPLRYGYIGVVNRSQKDIDGNIDIRRAIESESNFFQTHSAYADINDRLGTQYLQKALNKHLTCHIARTLPDLKQRLLKTIRNIEELLKNYQTEFEYDDPNWKTKAMVLFTIKFAETFKVEVLGNSDMRLNCHSYSAGAKIMQIFHNLYPGMLYSTEFTKEEVMKREIGYAIQNILGVRTGLFTPDKAFDLVIRSQIDKLEQPTADMLDMVGNQMEEALKIATNEELSKFPLLQREIESRASVQIATFVHKTREQLLDLLKYEHGYINTRHEDFVGFNYAEQKAYSRVLKRRHPGMEVKCRGWLNFNRSKKFWFVLSPDALVWYTEESETERVYMIPLDDCLRFRDQMQYNRLTLFHESSLNIYRDRPTIELQTGDLEQLELWKRSFIQVGVFSVNSERGLLPAGESSISQDILDTNDPWLERQIESIWILVDCYMNIVCKTLKDLVPKCITKLLIKDTVWFFEKKLVSEISHLVNSENLMEVNEAEVKKKERLLLSYEACKNALARLGQVEMPNIEDLQDPNFKYSPKKVHAKPALPKKPKEIRKDSPTPMDPAPQAPARPKKSAENKSSNFNREAPKRKSSASIQKALQQISTSSEKSTFY